MDKIKADAEQAKLIYEWDGEVNFYSNFYDDGYEKLKKFMDLYQNLPLDEIKKEWIKDEAYENVLKIYDKIINYCMEMISTQKYVVSKEEISLILFELSNNMNKVQSYNLDDAIRKKEDILNNLNFLETNNINVASDYVKNYNYIFNRNNKSHR
jgi:hypothetical protein